jgi:CHAT domain-containing protein
LQEAKSWLRDLRQEQVKVLAGHLTGGVWRGTVEEVKPLEKPQPDPKAERPYAHPFYWSAFILIGDPD